MLEESGLWESGSNDSSYHSDDDFNNDSNRVASSMLPIFASGGKKKPKKQKGKGKATKPEPKTITSSGASKTPTIQTMNLLEEAYADESDDLDMPQDMAEKIVGTAVIKVMEGHFAKLYSKIDILMTEVSTLKTTVASLVQENKKFSEVRGNAPVPEMQPPTTPATPNTDLTIMPRPQLQTRKRVGTPLAREILTRNWENQGEKHNATPMNMGELDADLGRLGKTPRLSSSPPTLMHSRYDGALSTAKRRVDDRGENDNGGRTSSLPNPRERQ
jgi:hypothetical protein